MKEVLNVGDKVVFTANAGVWFGKIAHLGEHYASPGYRISAGAIAEIVAFSACSAELKILVNKADYGIRSRHFLLYSEYSDLIKKWRPKTAKGLSSKYDPVPPKHTWIWSSHKMVCLRCKTPKTRRNKYTFCPKGSKQWLLKM